MAVWRAILAAIGIGGVGFGIVSWFVDKGETVLVAYLVIGIALSLVIIITLAELLLGALIKEKRREKIFFPKVIKAITDHDFKELRIIMNSSGLFSYGVFTSIYYDEGEFEKFIGTGEVENIQETGTIVVLIHKMVGGTEEIWRNVANDNLNYLKKIIVKPFITTDIFVSWSEGE